VSKRRSEGLFYVAYCNDYCGRDGTCRRDDHVLFRFLGVMYDALYPEFGQSQLPILF
jgi:hypothetical protein